MYFFKTKLILCKIKEDYKINQEVKVMKQQK